MVQGCLKNFCWHRLSDFIYGVEFPGFFAVDWRLDMEIIGALWVIIAHHGADTQPGTATTTSLKTQYLQSGQYSVSGQLERHWVTVSCCRQRECWYHRTSFQQKNIFLEKLYKTAVCARLVRDDVRYRDCTVDMSDKAQTESIAQVVRTKEHGLLTSLTAALIIQILILALVGVNVSEISNLK